MHEGVSISEDDYEPCAKLEKIPELGWIPSSGYFGVTAATGGLSDDHDVLSFITHSLVPLEERKEEVGDCTHTLVSLITSHAKFCSLCVRNSHIIWQLLYLSQSYNSECIK